MRISERQVSAFDNTFRWFLEIDHTEVMAMQNGAAVSGLLSALRFGKTLDEAVLDGAEDAKYAIGLWNGRREYQVRRADCWVESYLRGVVDVLFLKVGEGYARKPFQRTTTG